MSPDGELTEIVEIKDHPFFIAVQFHPELKSKPFAPHPLFSDFVAVAINEKGKRETKGKKSDPQKELVS